MTHSIPFLLVVAIHAAGFVLGIMSNTEVSPYFAALNMGFIVFFLGLFIMEEHKT